MGVVTLLILYYAGKKPAMGLPQLSGLFLTFAVGKKYLPSGGLTD
jgi:hypothetical protein